MLLAWEKILSLASFGNRLKSIRSVNSCSLYEHTYEYCCSLLYTGGHSINSSCILKRTCAVCYFWWLQTCSDRCRVPGAWRTSVTSACCSMRPSRSLGSWAKWPRSAAATWSPACAAASVWWARRRVTLLTRTQAARVSLWLQKHGSSSHRLQHICLFWGPVCHQQIVAGGETMTTKLISSGFSGLRHWH